MKTFSLNHWGSHPDLGNDDCWYGDDHTTIEAAQADLERQLVSYTPEIEYFELSYEADGEVSRISLHLNPSFDPSL